MSPQATPTRATTYQQPAIDTMLAAIKFDAQGLVPAIAQQHDTGEVLMMAYNLALSERLKAAARKLRLSRGRITYRYK